WRASRAPAAGMGELTPIPTDSPSRTSRAMTTAISSSGEQPVKVSAHPIWVPGRLQVLADGRRIVARPAVAADRLRTSGRHRDGVQVGGRDQLLVRGERLGRFGRALLDRGDDVS